MLNLSLSKITHWMWCDHTFSQRNKATRNAEGGGGLDNIEWGGVSNIEVVLIK